MYPNPLNVLLVGNGGREHAIAWKCAQSPLLGTLWTVDAPNAGIGELAQQVPSDIRAQDYDHLSEWCDSAEIHLVIVGPEAPLADGITDALASESRLVFGPTRAAARIEADKAYAKELMWSTGIPTATGSVLTNSSAAIEYIDAHPGPLVVKATGLAAGKGVIVCKDSATARTAIKRLMVDRQFGDAGDSVVIEERLRGQEVSVLALVNNQTALVLDPCQDHKAVGEGDVGPNTGGMGAYSPTPLLGENDQQIVVERVIDPLLKELQNRGIVYRGVLYVGLMLTDAGPHVLEFNCRFGDPECQPLLMRLQTDLLPLLWATSNGTLHKQTVTFDDRTSCCVVVCSEGYPGHYDTRKLVCGFEEALAMGAEGQQVMVFHGGTRSTSSGEVETAGGRVVSVTSLTTDLRSAQSLANAAASKIRFDGAFYRSDIGGRVLQN